MAAAYNLRSAGDVDPEASSSQSTSPPEGQSTSPPEVQSTPPSPVPLPEPHLFPPPVISPAPVAAENFVSCKSRFAGDSSESVEAFIDAIETYKHCCRIPDEDALRGLPMLLDKDAAIWWVGMKPSIPTWSMALEALRSSYGERRPAYRLFLEISATRQQEGESTDLFINQKRALFAKMPYSIPEEMQLDIVYGLLSPFLRTRLSRDGVSNFQELILRARTIAEMEAEMPTGVPETRTKATHDIPHRSRPAPDTKERPATGSDRTFARKERMGEQRPRFRPTCSFCHNRGHSVEECRKKNGAQTRQIACYGCGAPGVMKSNCPTCKTKTGAALSTIALATFPRQIPEPTNRQVLFVYVGNQRIRTVIDSGASRSVASSRVHQWLIQQGQALHTSEMLIQLADGVSLKHRTIPTTFMIFPDARNGETLLGMDFVRAAGLLMDYEHGTWGFGRDPTTHYPMEYEHGRTDVKCAAVSHLRDDEGAVLSPDERSSLEATVHQHEDIFMPGGAPTEYATHTIDTGTSATISVPPYRLTPAKKQILKAELDKMLVDGIAEECDSAWTSPVVLIPKKDGSVRYPLPFIDELVQSTRKGCYLSTIDLKAGYWQVKVAEADRDKTAFTTPYGTYRFTRMPFGSKNAPATFQRLIDRFRTGLKRDVLLLAYLDDLLDVSETLTQHLDDLQAVFERLRHFNLRANREKCVFVREQVKFLGHIISAEGIRPDPEKVEAIKKMPPPTNIKHLRTFLQTCLWFRKFIDGFSAIAQPLTQLTKDRPFLWGAAQQQAFETLKDQLTHAPVLAQADYSQPFVLRTDASNYALGAVLLQGEGIEERPIEYASRLLIPAERNYSTTEREALAVVWSVEKFRGYIDGHTVVVGSDYQPLRWLMTLKSPTGRLANVVADTLSRPNCDPTTTDSCGICAIALDLPRQGATDLRSEQLADPEVAKIIRDMENIDPATTIRWTEKGYLLTQGVLYRLNPDTEVEEPQLVVPVNMRGTIMKELHDAPTDGHTGTARTISKVQQRYYFPGMRKYIADYVRTCVECQRYKPDNLKPTGLLQTPVPAQRFEVLAIDLFGPLPAGKQGERWIFLVEDVAMLKKKQNLLPLYHPEGNPAERRNRDLKVQLAMLVKNQHSHWPHALPSIRFAMNCAITQATNQSPAYLKFARELRSPLDVHHDLRALLAADNYVPQITPYLKNLADDLIQAKETIEKRQDHSKRYAGQTRRPHPSYQLGDLGRSAKFAPVRDGPYRISKMMSPTTFLLSSIDSPMETVGKYHVKELTPYLAREADVPAPVVPKRRRGRPRTNGAACALHYFPPPKPDNNPKKRFITDRGTAFTNQEFEDYCREDKTTGVPRGNGQVERVNRTIIPVLTKRSIEVPIKLYLHVERVQRYLNSTYQRSISTTPFELLTDTKMRKRGTAEGGQDELVDYAGGEPTYLQNKKKAKPKVAPVFLRKPSDYPTVYRKLMSRNLKFESEV
ncbi:uncharacterized protein LOC143909251 [Arctopsyche grandis]|uniref:uncharacterized protein LOC143909251 n=1 Tax=Arctopsyche grandis TaxID=121162 RepID=UPI00406D66C4